MNGETNKKDVVQFIINQTNGAKMRMAPNVGSEISEKLITRTKKEE